MGEPEGHGRSRQWLATAVLAVLAPAAVLLVACHRPGRTQSQEAAAIEILAQVPLVDGHNDLPEQLRDRVRDRLDRLDLSSDTSTLDPPMHTDIPRLRKGHVGGQFWSVFVPTSLSGPAAVQVLFEQIDVVHRMAARYPDVFEAAYTTRDVERIHSSGRIACLIGMEGGHSIGNSLAVLREAYSCGARYMTLTHFKDTDWADSATDKPRHGGLTKFGREVVREMNRLGMLVDLSHVSDQTMLDALATSEAPVIFSHSSSRALCDHVRNVPDDILRKVAQKGGVVMVNFAPGFISEQVRLWDLPTEKEWTRLGTLDPTEEKKVWQELHNWAARHPGPKATLAQVADHIEHIRSVAGVDHVGLGSDFDGISTTPVGLEDVSRFPALIAELLRRGWPPGDVKKVAGENILRVMREAESAAQRIRRARAPSEALIEDTDGPASMTDHAGPGESSPR
jgi:membrane dipeptidase